MVSFPASTMPAALTQGRIALTFDQITINGRNYPMRATVVEALEAGGYREDAGKIGPGGGWRNHRRHSRWSEGAVTGILIGGGGVVQPLRKT